MIYRHKPENGYVVRDTHADRNPALSWSAKGLHGYLMQLPDDWQVNVQDLKNRSTDGRDATTAAMVELMAAGYVVRKRKHDAAGKFGGYEYHVFERPEHAVEYEATIYGKAVNGETVNGKTVNGLTVNGKSVTTNILSIPKTNILRKKESAEIFENFQPAETPPAPPDPLRIKTVDDAVNAAMVWANENAATVQNWYSVARVEFSPEGFMQEVYKFFAYYNGENSDQHFSITDPARFFKLRFAGWVMNSKNNGRNNSKAGKPGAGNNAGTGNYRADRAAGFDRANSPFFRGANFGSGE